MQTKSNINWKKLLQSVSLAAFAAAPIFGATGISQAAPPDHAPAHGYRNHNDRHDNDDDNDNDDNDRDNRDWDNRHRDHHDHDNCNNDNFDNSTRSLEGVVVNDLRGRDFVLRLDNGRNVRVQLDEREPQRLSQGDRVRVQGSFDQTNRDNRDNTRYNDNLVFRANDVRIIRDRNNNDNNNNNNYNGRRTLTGVVTNVRSNQRFTFRALNRTFDVVSPSRLPRGFSQGDVIRVIGDVRDNNISNANVSILTNNNGNYNSGYGNGSYGNGNDNGNYNGNYNNSNNVKIDFPATVLDSNERNNTLRVRGENGRNYTVRTTEADHWDKGDRVRIQGRALNGVIIANDIDRR